MAWVCSNKGAKQETLAHAGDAFPVAQEEPDGRRFPWELGNNYHRGWGVAISSGRAIVGHTQGLGFHPQRHKSKATRKIPPVCPTRRGRPPFQDLLPRGPRDRDRPLGGDSCPHRARKPALSGPLPFMAAVTSFLLLEQTFPCGSAPTPSCRLGGPISWTRQWLLVCTDL